MHVINVDIQDNHEEATLGQGHHGPASGFTCEGRAGGCAAGGTGQGRGDKSAASMDRNVEGDAENTARNRTFS